MKETLRKVRNKRLNKKITMNPFTGLILNQKVHPLTQWSERLENHDVDSSFII